MSPLVKASETTSDEDLVARAAADPPDREALEELFGRYYDKVSYWCLRVCGSQDEAADVAQEVFLRIQMRLGSFRGESRFSTWLYTVTRRVALNYRGYENRRKGEPLDEAVESAKEAHGPGVEEGVASRELIDKVNESIRERLAPLEARVLYLHYVQDLTLPQITRLLELSNRSGAKKYVVSAKRKLRRELGSTIG